MSFQGNLKSVSFPDVLQLLTLSKKTGTLKLTQNQTEKKVYLKNGAIIFAESNLLEDNFDNLLLSTGLITLEELQKARKVQELTGKDLPSTLVYLNLVGKEKIAELSRRYVENIVFSLFSWEDGDFIFEEGKLPDTDIIVSSLNTMNILMEGTRRIDEWTRIRNAIPPDAAVLQVASDVLAQMKEIKLSPVETLVLSLVDGERCIAEMRDKSSLDQLTFAKSLYNLISAGVVRQIGIKEYTQKPEIEQKTALELSTAIYNLAFDLVLDTIKKKMGKTGQKVIMNTYKKFKPKYKVLEFLTVRDDASYDFSNFVEMCSQIPIETRIHEVSTGLSNFLRELLNSITGTIGIKQKEFLSKQIIESVQPLLQENEELLKKFGLYDDFMRTLN
ncbi:hypothetical protein DRQ29_00885 [bacterium]|nr:MAG: hypothetical protein DRQ29_00885 [bacterium]